MGKSILREWGMTKREFENAPYEAVIQWMNKRKVTPCWDKDHGLIFKPRIGRETRKKFQEILQVQSKQDIERVRDDMRSLSWRLRVESWKRQKN
jgi:hypothetical protein